MSAQCDVREHSWTAERRSQRCDPQPILGDRWEMSAACSLSLIREHHAELSSHSDTAASPSMLLSSPRRTSGVFLGTSGAGDTITSHAGGIQPRGDKRVSPAVGQATEAESGNQARQTPERKGVKEGAELAGAPESGTSLSNAATEAESEARGFDEVRHSAEREFRPRFAVIDGTMFCSISKAVRPNAKTFVALPSAPKWPA